MLVRGGTSKGAYFVADDLPEDAAARDDLLLRIMGSPDPRQIDGVGGAHPLTSKVAVVSPAEDDEADVDYLFLQVAVDEADVSDQQNCGNLLAGVGPFALERQMIDAPGDTAEVRIRMLNTGAIATATFAVENGLLAAEGGTVISGAPFPAASIRLDIEGLAGSTCGALLPSGNSVDQINSVPVTLVDNGMPTAVLLASDMEISGYESCAELEADDQLRDRVESVRLQAGKLMGLGDVTAMTIPKMTMVAPPQGDGHLCTRTFIPHRCHDAIGVLGAVSVATAALLEGTPARSVAALAAGASYVVIEHPTGTFEAAVDLHNGPDGPIIERAGIIRTARKLMDGVVFPRP